MTIRLSTFVCLAHALASAAFSQELPDAAAVATALNQTVAFQDEVKAVSYSRSTDGYYLSFGAPYPKQILSVWAPAKLYERLPFHQSLVGRTVRIAGELNKSSTGPLLKMESAEQFQVSQTDESILSKPTLDGKQDRSQFQSAIYQTFTRQDFDTLDTLGRELLGSRERLDDGSWMIAAYFRALSHDANVSINRFAQVEKIIANWERAKPDSTVVPLVKVRFHLDRAWKWRGNGFAKDVTQEGWAGFKAELAIARDLLEQNPAGKTYPEYFALMQMLALGQSWPKEKYMRLFAEATSVAPDYHRFYYNTAYYLMPKWHGRKGEWEAFAEEQRQRLGAGGAGDGLYARIALSQQDEFKDLFRDSAISWETTASGLEYLIREYPASRSLKNLYANLAWKQRDRARLQRALPAIESNPDMTIWVNLENVAIAQRFAAGNSSR